MNVMNLIKNLVKVVKVTLNISEYIYAIQEKSFLGMKLTKLTKTKCSQVKSSEEEE